jgi:hypothetical protein
MNKDLYFWKWTLGIPYYQSARPEKQVEVEAETRITESDTQQSAINQSFIEEFESTNKREELDNRAADRELVQQRGANPFLTSQSTYVNDIIVRDMFLKPINTSQDKIKNSEENDS